MAEKLKSISKRIHWFLLLKGVIFAAAWFFFGSYSPSFLIFAIVALYLYFSPLAQSSTVAAPFLVLMLLTFLEPVNLLLAFIFGIVFFYILLVKELILIDRKSAYEVTVLSLMFLLLLGFYERFGGSLDILSLYYSLCGAAIMGFLTWSFIRFGYPTAEPSGVLDVAEGYGNLPALSRISVVLSVVLMWQFLLVALFLPVDFVYQTIIAFLGVIFIIDLVPQYLFGESSREKVLATLSVIFVLFVFVLGSARWGL